MRRSLFKSCTFMSAVGTKFYSLNSIAKQDGWAGKCTTLADSKRMSQSWWWLCWTRGQMHCTVSTAGRKREVWFFGSVGRAQPDRWHWEGLLRTGKGCPTKLSRIHCSQASRSQVCATPGGKRKLAPPKYLPHLLLARNASKDLGGIMPEPRKTIWPNLLQNNCWHSSWKVLSSSTCANTSGAWAPLTPPGQETGQGEMVVHLSLVSLRLLASTDTWKAGGKMGQESSSFCGEETRGNFQQKHQNPRKMKYLCSSKSSFFRLQRVLDRNWKEQSLCCTLHLSHRESKAQVPKWGFCNRKNSQLPQFKSKSTHSFRPYVGDIKKRKECFLALCSPQSCKK